MSEQPPQGQQGVAINTSIALVDAMSVMNCVIEPELAIALQEVLALEPTERRSWFIPLMASNVTSQIRLQIIRRLEIPVNSPLHQDMGESQTEVSTLSDPPTPRDDFAAQAFVWEVVLALMPDHAPLATVFVNAFLRAEDKMAVVAWLAPTDDIPTLPPFWVTSSESTVSVPAASGRQDSTSYFNSRLRDLSEIETFILDDGDHSSANNNQENKNTPTSTPPSSPSPRPQVPPSSPVTNTVAPKSTTPPTMSSNQVAPLSSSTTNSSTSGANQPAKPKNIEADWIARSQVTGTHSIPQAGKYFFCDLCGCKFGMFKSLSRDWREKHQLQGDELKDKKDDWQINWRDHMFTEAEARLAGRDKQAFK